MIDILGGEADFDPVEPHGLELEHRHGAGGVLQQGVVDSDGDLGPRCQFTLDQMRGENLRITSYNVCYTKLLRRLSKPYGRF